MSEDKNKQIRVRAILEVLGKPKEHVEKTIKDYVAQIKEDSGIMILQENYADCKEVDKLWSIFVELEIVFQGMEYMIAFCFNYMPSSIEVIKPQEILFKNSEISNIMNDLMGKLHDVDAVAKKLRAESDFLKRNLKVAVQNYIIVLLKVREMDDKEISKFTGIPNEELKIVLEELIKENKIKKEEDKYKLIC